MADVNLRVRFVSDGAGGLKAEVVGVTSKLADLEGAGHRAGQAVRSLVGSGSELRQLATQVLGAVGAYQAFAVAQQQVRGIIRAGIGEEEARKTFTALLGSVDLADERLRHLSELSKTLPFSLPQLRDASEQLELFGLNSDRLLPRIGRAADALGKDVTDVVQALSLATLGQTRGLKRYAIDVDAIARQTGISLEDGVKLTRSQMKEVVEAIIHGWDTALSDTVDTLTDLGRFVANTFERARDAVFKAGFGSAVHSLVDGVLAKIQELERNGTLAQWARQVSEALRDALSFLGRWAVELGRSAQALIEHRRAIAFLVGATGFALLGNQILKAVAAFRALAIAEAFASPERLVAQIGAAAAVGSALALVLDQIDTKAKRDFDNILGGLSDLQVAANKALAGIPYGSKGNPLVGPGVEVTAPRPPKKDTPNEPPPVDKERLNAAKQLAKDALTPLEKYIADVREANKAHLDFPQIVNAHALETFGKKAEKALVGDLTQAIEQSKTPVAEYVSLVGQVQRTLGSGDLGRHVLLSLRDAVEAASAKIVEATPEWKAYQDQIEAGTAAYRSILTPAQTYAEQVAALRTAMSAGKITLTQFNDGVEQLNPVFQEQQKLLEENRDPWDAYQQAVARTIFLLREHPDELAIALKKLRDDFENTRPVTAFAQAMKEALASAAQAVRSSLASLVSFQLPGADALREYRLQLHDLHLQLQEGRLTQREFNLEVARANDAFDSVAHGIRGLLAEFTSALRQMLAELAAAQIEAGLLKLAKTALKGLIPGHGGGSFEAFDTADIEVAHAGGIAGQIQSFRLVDPSVFLEARRFHTGGLAGLAPDEVPAILRRGEEVLPADNPRHRRFTRTETTHTDDRPVVIHAPVHVHVPDAAGFRRSEEQLRVGQAEAVRRAARRLGR